jgi:hypothetical protein
MTTLYDTQAAAGVLPARPHGTSFVIGQTDFLLQLIGSALAIMEEQTDEHEQQSTCSTTRTSGPSSRMEYDKHAQ